MAGGKRNKVIKSIFVFMLLFAFGIAPISVSHNDDVSIHIGIVEPEGTLRFGEPVKLKCYVDGLNEPYTVHWQHIKAIDDNVPLWEDIGCTEDTYEFILTEENANEYYRVLVVCKEVEYTAASTPEGADMSEKPEGMLTH